MSRARRTGWLAPHSPWQLAAGYTLWALWFVAAYGGLSVACAVAPPAAGRGPFTALNLALIVLTLGTVALLLGAAWRCWRAASVLLPLPLREGGGEGRATCTTTRGIHRRAAPHPASPQRGEAQIQAPDPEAPPPRDYRERAMRHRFMAGLSALLHLTAAAATVFVGLPLLWLPPCL